MANYKQPQTCNRRVRFYDGQFLQDQDFIDEQKYHLDRQHRHNFTLHVSGIATGLVVSSDRANEVKVSPGTAIDREGRSLVLEKEQTIEVHEGGWLYIAYHQVPDEKQASSQGIQDDTRWVETPCLFISRQSIGENDTYDVSELVWKEPPDPKWETYLEKCPPPPVFLAKLTVDGTGKVQVDQDDRLYSGLRLPDGQTEPPVLRAGAPGRVNLTGDLSISGHVGIGTTSPGAKLEVGGELKATEDNQELVGLKIAPSFKDDGKKDVKHYGLIVKSGNVGIGTTRPNARLHIQGEQKTGTGKIKSSGTSVTGGATGVNKTQFTSQLEVGDLIVVGDQTGVITAIASDTQLTIDRAFSPAFSTLTAFTFRPPLTRLADSGGATQFLVNASGNVHIGTTEPDPPKDSNGYLHARDVWLEDADRWVGDWPPTAQAIGTREIEGAAEVKDMENMSVDIAGTTLLCQFSGTFSSAAAHQMRLHLCIDNKTKYTSSYTISSPQEVTFHWTEVGLSKGKHTVKVQWSAKLVRETGHRVLDVMGL